MDVQDFAFEGFQVPIIQFKRIWNRFNPGGQSASTLEHLDSLVQDFIKTWQAPPDVVFPTEPAMMPEIGDEWKSR
jgi:hypothetical protein